MRAGELGEVLQELAADLLPGAEWSASATALRYEKDGSQLLARRVERRWIPPARWTVLYRHTFLRGTIEDTAPLVPREPDAFPLRVAPSRLIDVLAEDWHLPPFLGRGSPVDWLDYPTLADEEVRLWLREMVEELAHLAPLVAAKLSPDRMLRELRSLPSPVWIERRWLEDYGSVTSVDDEVAQEAPVSRRLSLWSRVRGRQQGPSSP